jgi:hypothetical protein
MMDGDDRGAVSGIGLWQGKPKYTEETSPVPLCPTHIPHDLTRARTRAAVEASR